MKWALLHGEKEVDRKVLDDPNRFNHVKEGTYLTLKPSQDRIVMIETNHDENAVEVFRRKHPAFFQEAWKFTVVRNPWDKYVSGWRYCKRTRHREFEDVVASPPTKEENRHDWHHITRSQTECIVDTEGKLIVDFVCRFERLQEGFDTVCIRAGIPRVSLPVIRGTRHRCYCEYYNDRTRDIIAGRYRQDIETFGYSFFQLRGDPRPQCTSASQGLQA
jgi:hypothetical protein